MFEVDVSLLPDLCVCVGGELFMNASSKMNLKWVEPLSDLKQNRLLGTYPFEDSEGLNTNNQKGIP